MTATMRVILAALLLAAIVIGPVWAEPQADSMGNAFTYQGRLTSDGTPVSETCSMEFRLYADAAGTSQVGTSTINASVPVADGLFSASLDFGSGAFNGDARWLGIRVQCSGDPSMVDLGLERLTPAPQALSAPWSGLSGVPAGFADTCP